MRPLLAAGFHPVRLVVALVIALGLASTPIQCGLATGLHSLFVPAAGAEKSPTARNRLAIVIDHGAHLGAGHAHHHDAATPGRAPATPLEAGMTGPSFPPGDR